MKIRPVILCGGAGTRLWPEAKNNKAKQFIDFGGWSLFEKTLDRVKASIYDYPIISTNFKYLKKVKSYLKKFKFKKYKIILEPFKKNTAPAILVSALIKDIPNKQPLMFFPADQLIEKLNQFNKAINKNKNFLTDQNIFIFGIKPSEPSSEFGYFVSKKIRKNTNKVVKFIEKPKLLIAKQAIKKKAYWNSGMFFLRKDSIIYNFKKYSPTIYKLCVDAVLKAKRLITDKFFLLLLPDDLIIKKNCSKNMISIHKKYNSSVMASKNVNRKNVQRWGIYDIKKKLDKNNFSIKNVVEKPSILKAPSNKAIIGRYILPKTIFGKLKKQKKGKSGEIHITDAIKLLILEKNKFIGHNFDGKYLDCGTMHGYIKSSLEISKI